MVICCVGILLSFVAGSFLDYRTVPYLFMFLPVIFLLGFLFFPETPNHMLARNNFKGAEKSFIFYRRGNKTSGDENKAVVKELELLQTILKTRENEKQNTNFVEAFCEYINIQQLYVNNNGRGAAL